MTGLLAWISGHIARYLSKPVRQGSLVGIYPHESLAEALRPGDVLLVDGNTRLSVAIKYLTQSTWSHAVLFVGDGAVPTGPGEEPRVFVEADVRDGVRAVPLTAYRGMHVRICRPVGLTPEELQKLIGYAVSRMGEQYDLKNVWDLARYLFPTPPVPARWRRRLLAFGSGDPSRAICSTLIAQAFQSVRYPILPEITMEMCSDPACADCYREIAHIRHYSLFTPRDFDLSPYFEVVKPTLLHDFDFHRLAWGAAGLSAR